MVLAVVVSNDDPLLGTAYQSKVPDVADVAVSVTVPLSQRDTLAAVGSGGTVLMVAVTAARVLLRQVPLSNST